MGNGAISDTLEGIVARAERANRRENGDYIGADGLLYCGKCRTPRQCRMQWIDGSERTLPVLCECRQRSEAKQKQNQQHKLEMERIERLKKSSLMDDKFKACTFDNLIVTPDNRRQVKISKRYAEKFDELSAKNQGLLFYGNVGTGKTHLACCIGNYVIERLHSVYATSFVKILQQAKTFVGEDDESAFVRRMNAASLVILDDLGAERSTDYALETVYNIIDSRYRSGNPMIVTTNLSLGEMQQSADIRYSRIYDRIFEVCYPVEFPGTSFRMKEAAHRFDDMKSILEG